MKRTASKSMHPSLRSEVMRSTGGKCVLCPRDAAHLHHRKLRSQGGTDDPDNLIPLCNGCHETIHANPEWAMEHGLIVPSYAKILPWFGTDWRALDGP